MAESKQSEHVRRTILAHDNPSPDVASELAALASAHGLGDDLVGALESYALTAREAETAKETAKEKKALAGSIWEQVNGAAHTTPEADFIARIGGGK
jgi:hypothetical protein